MSNDFPNKENARVVIIGAGAAGLYCAHLLQSTGANVIILEAKSYIGGRIHTVLHKVKGIETPVAVDHGAAWVHGTGYEWNQDNNDDEIDVIPEENPMMQLLLMNAKDISDLYMRHLKPVAKRGNPWVRPRHVLHNEGEIVLYCAGKRIDKDDAVIQEAITRHFDILQQVSDYGNKLYDQGRGMKTVHMNLQKTIDLVKRKSQEESTEQVEALVKWYQYLMEAWYGGQASDMQLMEFTRDEDEELSRDDVYCKEGDFLGPHCVLRHGMKTVLEPLLANGGAERVRCEQEVIRIEETSDNTVLVETKTGLSIEADCCVVTMPVGCLKDAVKDNSSMFTPKLSEEKVEAINALRMGKYKKVLLSFDRIFWPRDELMIGMVRNVTPTTANLQELGNELLFDNLWARDGIPMIEAILLGNAATWATGKDTDTICHAVLEFMKDSMGLNDDLREWFTGPCHVTRWEEDRFAQGAYSCYTLGTRERHTEALRQSEWNGKLVFAGEACVSEYEGSVHAALFSARNAAEGVSDYLQAQDSKSVVSK